MIGRGRTVVWGLAAVLGLVSCAGAGAGIGLGGVLAALCVAGLAFVIGCIGPGEPESSSAPGDAGAADATVAPGDANTADAGPAPDADFGPCLSVQSCLCVVGDETDDAGGALSAGLIGVAGVLAVRRRRRQGLERMADRLPDDVVRRLREDEAGS